MVSCDDGTDVFSVAGGFGCKLDGCAHAEYVPGGAVHCGIAVGERIHGVDWRREGECVGFRAGLLIVMVRMDEIGRDSATSNLTRFADALLCGPVVASPGGFEPPYQG